MFLLKWHLKKQYPWICEHPSCIMCGTTSDHQDSSSCTSGMLYYSHQYTKKDVKQKCKEATEGKHPCWKKAAGVQVKHEEKLEQYKYCRSHCSSIKVRCRWKDKQSPSTFFLIMNPCSHTLRPLLSDPLFLFAAWVILTPDAVILETPYSRCLSRRQQSTCRCFGDLH